MGPLFSILLLSFCFWSVEAAPVKYGFTKAENQWMAEQNGAMAQVQKNSLSLFKGDDLLSFNLLKDTSVRAFAEYEKAGYLIFSSEFAYRSKAAKLAMAKNLPKDMTLVVFTGSTSKAVADRIRSTFSKVIEGERLKVVYMPQGGRGFWARDGVPVPVWRWATEGSEELAVVDAVYYHNFEPDEEFASLFGANFTEHDFYFEGGNFIANSKNECLIVNKRATQQIPNSIFRDHYGCKVLTRLPHVKGIGHADESVKFIDDQTVLTDEKSYVSLLEDKGYTVVMLPRPDREYETYVNSLIVNGVVYVPVFNEKNDEKALDVYRQFGFNKVIGLNSTKLSNEGMGSLHCITMTYPQVPLNELVHALGGSLL